MTINPSYVVHFYVIWASRESWFMCPNMYRLWMSCYIQYVHYGQVCLGLLRGRQSENHWVVCECIRISYFEDQGKCAQRGNWTYLLGWVRVIPCLVGSLEHKVEWASGHCTSEKRERVKIGEFSSSINGPSLCKSGWDTLYRLSKYGTENVQMNMVFGWH